MKLLAVLTPKDDPMICGGHDKQDRAYGSCRNVILPPCLLSRWRVGINIGVMTSIGASVSFNADDADRLETTGARGQVSLRW
jgi:hypothetical protein